MLFMFFNVMLFYLFFKGKVYLIGKDLGIIERGRGIGNL